MTLYLYHQRQQRRVALLKMFSGSRVNGDSQPSASN
ncbi:predicted protein [Botrytis cinerea T4]|uniref:Uncharacterized protein n=1 Tax=Botryotinia fuckeliana (strain T4) TaxID=999810 RepID=G2YNX9_BOTF4|nr:predicted protein [Botrytis cinerea T4]